MSTAAIVEEALSEGRALFTAAAELRDTFRSGRAEVEALKAEAKQAIDGVLSTLRAGLDDFKAQGAAAAAGTASPPPAGPPATPAAGTETASA